METAQINKTTVTVFTLLKLTYGLVPIAAGLDKFAGILTHWENYINPSMVPLLPFPAHTLMMVVGDLIDELDVSLLFELRCALWSRTLDLTTKIYILLF